MEVTVKKSWLRLRILTAIHLSVALLLIPFDVEANTVALEAPIVVEETIDAGEMEEPNVHFVDYIVGENNGSNVALEYDFDISTKLEIEMAITTISYSTILSSKDEGNNRLVVRQESSNGLYVAYGWYNSKVFSPEQNEVFKLTQDGNKTYINDVLVRSATAQLNDTNSDIRLGYGKSKVYGVKLWKNDQVVEIYKPAIDENGLIGLYASVDEKFIPSTGTFSAGNFVSAEEKITEALVDEVEQANKQINYTMLNDIKGISNGSYIELDDDFDVDTKLKINMATTNTSYTTILSSKDEGSNRLEVRQEGSKGLYVAYGWYNSRVFSPDKNVGLTLTQDGNKTYINGELVRSASAQSIDTDDDIRVGYGQTRIYSVELWKGGHQVRNYKPAMNPDGIIGLYDIENDVFLEASGAFEVDTETKGVIEEVLETEETPVVEEVLEEIPVDGETIDAYEELPNFQLVEDMKVGWNLGGTLESVNFQKLGIYTTLYTQTASDVYETLWGSPKTTKENFQMIKDGGFNAVRIPISYYDHFDDNYNIDPEWLDRIEEVVNYALDYDMYCIINLQHEEMWLYADLESIDEVGGNFEKVWLQIAERFKMYDERLIFEGFNEIRNKEKAWSTENENDYIAVNKLNQIFVDTIRSTTAYNIERFLVIKAFGGSTTGRPIDELVIPTDIIDNHIIVSVHNYRPSSFTWTEREINWKATYSDWDDERDGVILDEIFEELDETFISKGVPVIIGEFAAYNKNNTDDRAAYSRYFVQNARDYGMTAFWWDTGGKFNEAEEVLASTLLDRQRNEWYFEEIIEALVE